MMKRLLLTLLYLSLAYSTVAQNKMNFSLARKVNDREINRNEAVSMLIQGDVKQIKTLVQLVHGKYKYSAGNIASVSLSISQLSKIISNSCIKRVEAFPPQVQPLSDSVLCNNNVLPVHQGQAPLSQGYDGSGVIIGFIDTGIDFTHPDFKDSLGKTRILWLWDFTLPNASNTPMPYNYGQEWSKADIDAGTCTHNPTGPAICNPNPKASGHGTHVAGVATGNALATGQFLGTAPKADIIFVAIDFCNGVGSISDAVNYIYSKAQAAGKPCVINTSLGSDFGLHDGKDLESQIIKNLIQQKTGQSLVAAAGNAGNKGPVHLTYTTSPTDTNFTFFSPVKVKPTDPSIVYLNIVADSNNLKNISFSIGADKMLPIHSFRGNIPFVQIASTPIQTPITTNLMNAGNRIGVIQSYLDTVNGVYSLQYYITPDSTSYYWRLLATGTGSFDLWNFYNNLTYAPIVNSGLPSIADMPDSMYYKMPDTDKSIEGGFQCLDEVITVMSYVNRKSYFNCGTPAVNSSKVPGQRESVSSVGPTRDGRQKPDIASPGDMTMGAAVGSCIHVVSNGTSNACPGVTGIAALYLQKNPTATAAQVKQAIINSGTSDFFTGNSLPDKYWGHGKVNALTALTETLTISHPSDTSICENENAVFGVKYNGTGLTYQWQVDQGSGFTNLSNIPPYAGVTDDSLKITTAPFSLNGYKYRCIINNCTTCVKSFHIATLTVNPAPGITTASNADSVCFNSNSQTSLLKYSSTTNSPSTYSIIWDAAAISKGFVNDTDALLSVSPVSITVPANAMATTYTGTISVKNALACSSISGNNFTLTVDTLPIAIAGGTTSICSDSTAIINGANAQYGNIVWVENGIGNITSGATTLTPIYTASPADEGNIVTLTMTVTSTNNCSATATYTIKVDSLPIAIINGSKSICSDSTITINTAVAKNGSIVWTHNGAGSIAGASSAAPTYTAAKGDEGNTVLLTMTVTSTNSCLPKKAIASYTLAIDSLPTATAVGNQTICADGTASINGTIASGGTILWTENGAGTITSGATTLSPVYTANSIDGGNTIILTMTVSSNNNCSPSTAIGTYTIYVNALPNVNITGLASSYCYNASAQTLIGTPSSGVFSGNGITDAVNGIFNPVAAGSGTHTITYTYSDNNNCTNAISLNTTVLPTPVAPDSCSTTTSIGAIIQSEPNDTISSNVFTPNDDGVNDVFYSNIKRSSLTKYGTNAADFLMNIYNRWGELIYFSTSPNIGWDGTTIAGIKVSSGTYYYTIYFNGNRYKGFVSLIR
jgi:gliding motility-associated-like protein